jgi:hypothetical protein
MKRIVAGRIAHEGARAYIRGNLQLTDFGTADESSIQNVINFRAIRKFAWAAVCEFHDPLEVW